MTQNYLIGLIYVAAITSLGAWVSTVLYAQRLRRKLSRKPLRSVSQESSQTLTEYCQDGLGI